MTPTLRVDVHLTPDDLAATLREDVRRGLRATPRELPPKWFYDDRGCELFDEITRLPEYYPTERERSILLAAAEEIAATTGATTLIELGSGTSDKTRTLLDAFTRTGTLDRFVPFDVNEATVRSAGAALMAEYPGLSVHAVVGDFERHLDRLPDGGRRVIAFLGSTIGNFGPAERKRFVADVADTLAPGDWLLLGTDLVKDPDRLVRAYDDAAGVTAAFNRNVLTVVNRELAANFPVEQFEHVARWDATEEWIEMRLRATVDCVVRVEELAMDIGFDRGEEMRTEISAKFRRDGIATELADAGLVLERFFTDPDEDFAVSLSQRV